MTLRRFLPTAALLALIALTCGPRPNAWGQKPPPPSKPSPQAPVLGPVAPLGVQRGTTVDLTLTGTNLAGPTGLLLTFPAKVTIPTDRKNGEDNTKLRVRLNVPADAPLGPHGFRLATTRGMSNLRLFCVDDLPQVMRADTARNKATPQPLPIPSVAVGQLNGETSDWYKVTATAGQRLTFEVLGHRLGFAIDPQLSLYDARTMREIAHANDSPGCQTDPRLTHTFKEAGDYLVEVRDTINRGGTEFWYRLRVGDFPAATVPIPMAAQRGGKISVNFAGPAVEGVAPVEVAAPADPTVDTVWVAPKGANGLYGWPVVLALSDHEELVEQEPNNDPAKANRVPVPGGITGRFQQSEDVDHYVFAGKKGQKLLVEAQTLELHAPTLVYMVLRSATTKAEIARSNPQLAPPADQRIEFAPTEDGDYVLEVQHLNYLGGPSEAYRLTVTPSVPGFDLALGIEQYDVGPEGVLALPVLVSRRGYTGPIEVTVQANHPGIVGQLTIPAKQPAKPALPGGTLQVQVARDVPAGPYLLALVGKATVDGRPVTELASLTTPLRQSLANLPFPPRHLLTRVALAVKERAPFALKVEPSPLKLAPGAKVKLKITAVRKGGYAGPIALEVRNLPANVTASKTTIPMGKDAIEVEVSAAANAAAASRADANVLGTATALNNLQGASPNFTVLVGKK
ncbi:MAG: pre-peptidase C-terminal domain-containing protein [Gemmataceae bacterium]|nr:pre-peptidase C-terminal domain-containing protein [Gemmataceae bacterium]